MGVDLFHGGQHNVTGAQQWAAAVTLSCRY